MDDKIASGLDTLPPSAPAKPFVRFDILTLFPGMFESVLGESIIGRAVSAGLIEIHLHNIRDYAPGKHQVTDDTPYGGGGGMVMKVEPIFNCAEAVLAAWQQDAGITTSTDLTTEAPQGETLADIPSKSVAASPIILLSPQGRVFSQQTAQRLAACPRMLLICGRYEGFDERVREHLATEEISIGDYVISGGEIAAMTVVDAVTRLLPGALGCEVGAEQDSHAMGLLEYPHYTRPAIYRGWGIPEILTSGHHAEIAKWRRQQALKRTWERRPDILARAELTKTDQDYLHTLGWHEQPT